jgi:peptidoglycan/xylan/chitin deacetylase (PgdA/CDA1 family)
MRRVALVLCYHAVSDGWPDILSIGPATLERQLQSLLRRGYRPARSADVVNRSQRNSLHVTFDDAFKSVASAVPILERLGVPATVFACSAYADDGRPLAIPELATEASRYPAELATMDWDELRSLAERGVEIGSHTATHPHLTELDDGELGRELRESRARIEDELRRPCSLLAYPYGDDDARVHAAARAAGYEAAFALPGSFLRPDRHAFPRVGVFRPDSPRRFALKTSPAGPALAWLGRGRRRKARRA